MTDLIEYEELLRFLYQCPVGIAQIDLSGMISLLNPKGSQLLMPLARESMFENILDVLDPYDPSLRSLVASAQDYGTICEHRVLQIDSSDANQHRIQHLAITLLKIGPETIMAVFEDVSSRVAAEAEAREQLTVAAIERGRSESAAEVLHDIGNAIVGIGTRTAMLLEDANWPELDQLEKLGSFLVSRSEAMATSLGSKKAEAMIQLLSEIRASLEGRRRRIEESMQSFTTSVLHIQEILNLHRHYLRQSVQAGQERLTLKSIADDAVTIQAVALEKRSITLEKRVAPNLPKLSIDRTKIVQVLVNLLKNACEAFDASPPSSGRRIILEIVPIPDRPGICLKLHDNACGFEPDRAEYLFEKHTSTKGRGSGLGLYHCRKVVESHGGTLVMRSDGPGCGATAIMTLPDTPTTEPDHAIYDEHASSRH